jgi:hypothetical protein
MRGPHPSVVPVIPLVREQRQLTRMITERELDHFDIKSVTERSCAEDSRRVGGWLKRQHIPATQAGQPLGNLQRMYADVGTHIGIDIARANLRMKATGKTGLIATAIEDESLQVVPEIQFQV